MELQEYEIFTCATCAGPVSSCSLQSHLKICHGGENRPQTTTLKAKKPTETMATKPFACAQCAMSFTTKFNLQRHIKTSHCDGSNFACLQCAMSFPTKFSLHRHIKTDHCDSSAFPCAECKKSFTSYAHLHRHVKCMHGAPKSAPMCDVCGKSFRKKFNLREHLKRVHNAEKGPRTSFACDLCARTYSTKTNVRKHIRLYHNGDEKRGRCKCNLCEESFANVFEFEAHLPMHDISLRKETLHFESIDEFHEWKRGVERRETAFYAKTNYSAGGHILYFRCNRSGKYRTKVPAARARLRRMKDQGTIKMDAYCPAHVRAALNSDGSVEVKHCGTHVGHRMEPLHARIPIGDSQLLRRHAASVRIGEDRVAASPSGREWAVFSKNKKRSHTVSVADERCRNGCAQICPICKVCVHKYACTCEDARRNMCKHVHLVCRLFEGKQSEGSMDYESEENIANIDGEQQTIEALRSELNDRFVAASSRVLSLLQSTDSVPKLETIQTLLNGIEECLNTMDDVGSEEQQVGNEEVVLSEYVDEDFILMEEMRVPVDDTDWPMQTDEVRIVENNEIVSSEKNGIMSSEDNEIMSLKKIETQLTEREKVKSTEKIETQFTEKKEVELSNKIGTKSSKKKEPKLTKKKEVKSKENIKVKSTLPNHLPTKPFVTTVTKIADLRFQDGKLFFVLSK